MCVYCAMAGSAAASGTACGALGSQAAAFAATSGGGAAVSGFAARWTAWLTLGAVLLVVVAGFALARS